MIKVIISTCPIDPYYEAEAIEEEYTSYCYGKMAEIPEELYKKFLEIDKEWNDIQDKLEDFYCSSKIDGWESMNLRKLKDGGVK